MPRAFVTFIVMAAVLIASWSFERSRPELGGLPSPFRRVLEWNGKLWAKLYSPHRLNSLGSMPKGKPPRVNGDLGLTTPIDLENWKMDVIIETGGTKSRKLVASLAELKALPRTETATEFYCIEGWSEKISYAGVRFSDFLKYYHLDSSYRYVGFETPDRQYYVSLDMDSMLHPQTVLAYEMNGAPLSLANGAPLRLVVPIKYGIKSLKRIGTMILSNTQPPDYWAEEGYDWFAGL